MTIIYEGHKVLQHQRTSTTEETKCEMEWSQKKKKNSDIMKKTFIHDCVFDISDITIINQRHNCGPGNHEGFTNTAT